MRRRGVNNAGKKDPVRVLAIFTVRSPLVVETVLSRVPLRYAYGYRCAAGSATMCWDASASIRACRIVCSSLRIS
jgi:hypothetical protein